MGETPESRYTTINGDYIAYQVFGEGEVDVLWVGGCIIGVCPGCRSTFLTISIAL